MDLDEIRGQINEIDDKIADLFKQRMSYAKRVADWKKENNTNVSDKRREREILGRVCGNAGEFEMHTRALFSCLFNLSSAYQSIMITENNSVGIQIDKALANTPETFPKKANVACQGVEGAYSQQACDKLFPIANIMYVNSFDKVFDAVETGLCKYGMIPLENNYNGTVSANYKLMEKKNFRIAKSIALKVDHALLVKPGIKISEITEILSHEQALKQCAEFIKNTFPDTKITTYANTAAAAKFVAENPEKGIAAIASSCCGDIYGLDILKENIQETENNYTRFICISKGLEIYPGSDRISIMLTIPHKHGSLYHLLGKFESLGINLEKIENRPIMTSDSEVMFYLDFSANVSKPETDDGKRIIALMNELSASHSRFVFLGNYSEH